MGGIAAEMPGRLSPWSYGQSPANESIALDADLTAYNDRRYQITDPTAGVASSTRSPALSLVEGQHNGVRELEFRRFSYLKTLPSEPPWLWAGFLVPGSLTMLAGYPFAGKSTLVGGLLRALEQGTPFLGRATTKATALLISEEDNYALHSRATVLGLLEAKSEYVSRSGGVFGLDWGGVIKRATEHALDSGHSLLVVDTFPGLAGLRGEEENDAGAIGERLRPLQEAAGEGLAVLFLHHLNKQGQPRGSQAFRGVVDIEMRLHKGRSHTFRIESVSRFATGLARTLRGKLVDSPAGWFYQVHARAEATEGAKGENTDTRLWNALIEAGTDGLTYAEIHVIDGLSEDIAKKRFRHWFPEQVGRRGQGTRRDPYRWFACST